MNSEFEVSQSIQFKVNELVIVTKRGNIDISQIYEEINIFDSLFMPVMSGKLVLNDSIGLSSKLLFDGSEALLIDIVKTEVGSKAYIANFRKAFRLYKQADRNNDNLNSEKYTLSFVADELIFSDQKRVNQGYDTTYTEMVKKLLSDYLEVPKNQLGGIYDETVGIRKVVIPNLRPLEAIEWCTRRSVDAKNSPNFVFYQNVTGYNFASLSNLLVKPIVLDIKFEPKNVTEKTSLEEISSARSMEVVSQTDAIEKTRAGVNAGKFIGFDPLTRTIATKNISYDDHYKPMKHANQNPNVSVIDNREKLKNVEMFNSKKTVSSFGTAIKLSKYVEKYDPTSISKVDNIEDYLYQRRAIFRNLMERRIRLTMPGNFQLSSGFNVFLNIPELAQKPKGTESEDKLMDGKYIIVASRQIIGYDKHETIIEVATTSTDNEFIPVGPYDPETKEILEY